MGTDAKALSPAAQAVVDKLFAKSGDNKTAKAIQDAHDALHEAGAVCDVEEEDGEHEDQEKMVKAVNDSVNMDTVLKARIVAAVSHGRHSTEDLRVFKQMHDSLVAVGAECDGLQKSDSTGEKALIKSLMKIVKQQGEQIQAILSKPQEIKIVAKQMNGKDMKDGDDDEDKDGEEKPPKKQKAIRVEGADDMIKSIENVHKRGGRVIRNLSDVLN